MLEKFSANPALKIVAISLALILWVIMSAQRREQITEQAFRLPLQFTGVPEGLVVTSPVPDAINVRLRGPESRILTYTARNRAVQVDLSAAEAGELDQAITVQQMDVPRELQVVTIDPPRIPMRLERREEKIVPIRPFTVGNLPSGYRLGETSVEPNRARISGPTSVLEEINEVATERIILSERRSSFQNRYSLVADDSFVRIEEPQNVLVTIVVTPIPTIDPDSDGAESD
jgi:YbbR domain-containing protein